MTEQQDKREIVLRTRGLTKRYGGIHALEDADYVLHQGEHVAIVGDNGAGKSTFVRQITGVEQPTSGEMFFGNSDTPTRFASSVDARLAGIETVHQDLALAEDLDGPANVFLGRERLAMKLGPFSILADRKMEAESREALHRTGVKLQT